MINSSKNHKSSGKNSEDYKRRKKKNQRMKVSNDAKFIFPINKESSNVRFYEYFQEHFNIIHDTHLSLGRGRRNKLLNELKKSTKIIL